ncbi:MAG: class I SAM-dependent methyltransferase [Pseudomonadota bacterium]|nr:class I SAM-dependent methyltransferase [Pseudomonadota bacterium]
MKVMDGVLERKLQSLTLPLAVVLPNGSRIGAPHAAVTLHLKHLSTLTHIARGEVGKVASDYVENRLDFDGSVRELMAIAAQIVSTDPTRDGAAGPWNWLRDMRLHARSRARHHAELDAQQVQFHYDVSDEFYRLWLDPKQLYSCAYFSDPGMDLGAAQQAKLDHICRKLLLKPGERFLDIGAGWGGLLMWAVEHYGVQGHGITLSRNQHAHMSQMIAAKGLGDRVKVELLDYRDLPEDQPYDKIASVGMFEHVGRALMPAYFAKIRRLLKAGGLLMNHGITAGGTRNHQLGAGMGEFIERYIFPGGELLHVSKVTEMLSDAQLEPLDLENLRPHYARTLWAWSDRLEARLAEARAVTRESVVRAYRLYLAGSAMSFEQGWMALFQILAAKPSGRIDAGSMRGAQSDYPFNRAYMYRP